MGSQFIDFIVRAGEDRQRPVCRFANIHGGICSDPAIFDHRGNVRRQVAPEADDGLVRRAERGVRLYRVRVALVQYLEGRIFHDARIGDIVAVFAAVRDEAVQAACVGRTGAAGNGSPPNEYCRIYDFGSGDRFDGVPNVRYSNVHYRDRIAFLLSAAVLTRLPADRQVEQGKGQIGFWQELGDGIRYVRKSYLLVSLAGMFAVIGLANGAMQPLGVYLLTERLGLPKENLQWFMMVNGGAMLIGGGLVAALSKKIPSPQLLVFAMLADAVAAQFMIGFVFPCFMIGISTIIMENTEMTFIGRVNGVLNPSFMGMRVISMSAAGWLKDTLSLVAVFQAAGAVVVVGLLFVIPLFKLKKPIEHKLTAV